MKKTIKNMLIFVFLFSVSLAICMRSELNPISKRVPTVDSDVYIYIGQELQNGKVIYKDIFDHKGPLFYLIEFIGTILSYKDYIGVWLIELLFMNITLWFLYKTSYHITKNMFMSMLIIFVGAVPLSKFFINGNYPEEYSLPFIAAALYYFVKTITNLEEPNKKNFAIIGITFSCVCLIKINLISVWIVYVGAILIRCLMLKQWNRIKEFFIYFCLGAIGPAVIAIIILIIQGNLSDCIKEYILFNFKYATDETGSLKETIRLFATDVYIVSIISCVIDFVYKKITKEKTIQSVCALMYLLLCMAIIVMPKNQYKHYGIVLLPTYIVPLSLAFRDIISFSMQKVNVVITALITIILLYMSFNITRRDIAEYKKDVMIINNERFEFRQTDLTEYIKSVTQPDDKILVLGNECNIYLMSERESNCKYIYQIPISNIDPNIMKETIDEIDTKKPKLIVLKLTEYTIVQDYFYEYLDKTDAYEMKEAFGKYIVYTIKQ